MRNPFSSLTSTQHSTMFSPSLAGGLAALVAALACPPLLADEIGNAAKLNASNTSQAGISWMSGGIGDEARDEMRKAASGYNVLVVFSERGGAYLAEIPFSVSGRDGREVLAGTTDGPLLYIKLPAASYRLSAQIDGNWQSKRIYASTSGRPVRTMFISRGG